MDSLSTILLSINDSLETESELRERIKESVKQLDRQARTITATVNRIHATPGEKLNELATMLNSQLSETRPAIANVAALIPINEFFKWQQLYTRSLQSLVFAAALAEFVLKEDLITMGQVNSMLSIDPSWSDRFCLTPEDYLHAVISMVNELSRLAVNSVILGNTTYPLKISSFVGELFAAYQLLNLKNDSLRRRFDSLKYDLKKIEEVVYDLSLRGLTSSSQSA